MPAGELPAARIGDATSGGHITTGCTSAGTARDKIQKPPGPKARGLSRVQLS